MPIFLEMLMKGDIITKLKTVFFSHNDYHRFKNFTFELTDPFEMPVFSGEGKYLLKIGGINNKAGNFIF